MKYQVIYADPPWTFGSKLVSGRATAEGLAAGRARQKLITEQYPVMTAAELREYFSTDVAALADNPAVLFMWTTDAHLPLALQLGELAGFQYKTVGFIWNKKTSTGKQVCFMGTWTMKGSELCLLFTKGSAHAMLRSRSVRQLVEAERGRHSCKPDEVAERIEEMFPEAMKIELFARRNRAGWRCVGNEL